VAAVLVGRRAVAVLRRVPVPADDRQCHREAIRLAASFIVHTGRSTLGRGGVLIAAGVVTAMWSDAVAVLAASVLAAALVLTARPTTTQVRARFTR
jgi:hypothetical protein